MTQKTPARKITAAKRRLKLTDEHGLSIDVPFDEQSSLISPSGRAAIRIAGELLRTKRADARQRKREEQ